MTAYTWQIAAGRAVLADEALTHTLARAWSAAYRASRVPAQRDDELYAPEQQHARIERIRKELQTASAQLAYVRAGDELAGFFWGLSLADLEQVAPDKAEDVLPFAQPAHEQVAYLSLLGTLPEHAGRRLGTALTLRLCHAFRQRGMSQAVSRTINESALDRVYRPLGFREYRRFTDPRSRNALRIIFGAPLSATPVNSATPA